MLNTDTIHVTHELLALLSEIDEFKGAWRALGTIASERLNALRRIATIERIGSSTRPRDQKTLRPDLMKFLMPIYFLEHSGKPSMMPETAFLRSSSYQNSQLAIV
jgi:hypothetical protein